MQAADAERNRPGRPLGSKRRLWPRLLLAGLAVLGPLILFAVADAWVAIGSKSYTARRERITSSSQFRDGKLVDTIPRVDPDLWAVTARWLRGTEHARPQGPLPVALRSSREFEVPAESGLRITWFGHSTLLVELEGRRLLLDPMWSQRCSPSRFLGPQRFHPPPIPLDELPALDAVLISHDHYDHLDYASISALKTRNVPFVVPLGVGAHLEYWGVARDQIRELDWWQETNIGSIRLVATPARHFSGRGFGSDITLWSGWAMLGKQRRAYYSGDTAMFEGFAEIGARLGPFDATMIEVGAYDAMWADVHLGPEQAVQAHQSVRGGVLIPVHWGTFALALHTWVEPAERVLAAASAAGVRVVTPRPGESVDPLAPSSPQRWWPQVPWRTAAEAPVVSSGLQQRPPF